MKCDWCESTDSITTINGMHACVDHIDTAMHQAFKPARMILYGEGQPGHGVIGTDDPNIVEV